MSLPTKPASERKTIGVFASQVGRAWGAEFISGITAAAEANNVNLVHFIGGRLTPQVSTEKPDPSFGLYDLAKPDQFDGLILTSDIAYGTTPAELKIFSDHYGAIPIVTQSVELSGATMYVPDNADGIRAVVRHLIEEHGYKRIAFICGIPGQVDAEQRFQAYKDELKAHDLRYDEGLVVNGDYTADSGK
jgi:DNA-binding LacI/PurR family transcriptional regulator